MTQTQNDEDFPKSHTVNRAYINWKDWDESKFGSFTELDALYFFQELKSAGVILNSNLKILEIGFGNGVFAGWAKANGFDYLGTKINPELVQRAGKQGISAIASTADLRDILSQKTFDAIVSFDVIEHLSLNDIIKLLEQIHCLLKAGGVFIARIPSGDSPFSGPLKYGDITHRTILGSGAISQLAAMTGFDLVQVRSPVLPVRNIGMLRALRRIGVILVQKIVGKLIRVAFQDNRRSVISSNMIFVFRVN